MQADMARVGPVTHEERVLKKSCLTSYHASIYLQSTNLAHNSAQKPFNFNGKIFLFSIQCNPARRGEIYDGAAPLLGLAKSIYYICWNF